MSELNSEVQAERSRLESGRLGRLCTLRLRPNEDLVEAIEAFCREAKLQRAVLRSAVGSLNDAVLEIAGRQQEVKGPGLEIFIASGEVAADPSGRPRARLSGAVCDSEGRVTGGRFVSGRNFVCITAELLLQEWLPDDEGE